MRWGRHVGVLGGRQRRCRRVRRCDRPDALRLVEASKVALTDEGDLEPLRKVSSNQRVVASEIRTAPGGASARSRAARLTVAPNQLPARCSAAPKWTAARPLNAELVGHGVRASSATTSAAATTAANGSSNTEIVESPSTFD